MTSVQEPPAAKPSMPYRLHPLFRLRRLTLWTLAISFFSMLFANAFTYHFRGLPSIYYITSVLFIGYDLVTWAMEKILLDHSTASGPTRRDERGSNTTNINAAARDDESKNPEWPKTHIIIIDLVLSILFFLLTLQELYYVVNPWARYDNIPLIIEAYSSLSLLAISILHGRAFLKENRARKKINASKKKAQLSPCAHCCHPACQPHPHTTVGGVTTKWVVAGPSTHVLVQGEPVLPRWVVDPGPPNVRQRDVEAGRFEEPEDEHSPLVNQTPESSSGSTLRQYATIDNSVHSLKSEGEEIVSKKGKRRVVGKNWYGKDHVQDEAVEDI